MFISFRMAKSLKTIPDIVRRRLAIGYRDCKNLLFYGFKAPLFAERIYINQRNCKVYCTKWNREYTGRVIGGDWDLGLQPIERHPKFEYCVRHWVNGLSWQASGAYDLMKKLIDEKGGRVDDCLTFEDIKQRYERLDQIFFEVKHDMKVLPQQVHQPGGFRESGGVYVHINRNNDPVFGGGGVHRFAITKILELDWIPAQLGVVHKEAIKKWIVYRNSPVGKTLGDIKTLENGSH